MLYTDTIHDECNESGNSSKNNNPTALYKTSAAYQTGIKELRNVTY